MNKKEFDKQYVGKKLVVNCKTKEDTWGFLKLADRFGYCWCDGDSYLKHTEWIVFGGYMCYNLKTGVCDSKDYYKENNFKIITYSIKEDVPHKR